MQVTNKEFVEQQIKALQSRFPNEVREAFEKRLEREGYLQAQLLKIGVKKTREITTQAYPQLTVTEELKNMGIEKAQAALKEAYPQVIIKKPQTTFQEHEKPTSRYATEYDSLKKLSLIEYMSEVWSLQPDILNERLVEKMPFLKIAGMTKEQLMSYSRSQKDPYLTMHNMLMEGISKSHASRTVNPLKEHKMLSANEAENGLRYQEAYPLWKLTPKHTKKRNVYGFGEIACNNLIVVLLIIRYHLEKNISLERYQE